VVVYSGWAAPLAAGVTVGPGLDGDFKHRPQVMEIESAALSSGTNCVGPWAKAQNRYLGLEITIKGQHHFGWARISMPGCPTATITGYAYETVPNKPIVTGATTGSEERSKATPPTGISGGRESASLGLLARGSAGLELWRRDETM
jgi:hypothetical protein